MNTIQKDQNSAATSGVQRAKAKAESKDLIECLKNYGRRFMTLYRRQGSRPFPRKRNTKRQNGCLRRTYKYLWKKKKLKAKEIKIYLFE